MIIRVNVKYFFFFAPLFLLFPLPSDKSFHNCGIFILRSCSFAHIPYYPPARKSVYARSFNLTRRLLSARIPDQPAALPADRIPVPVPVRQAQAVQDRQAMATALDQPAPVNPIQRVRQAEARQDPARQAAPTAPARREAREQEGIPGAGAISANPHPRRKIPKAKLKWKAPSVPCWQAPCSK